MKTVFCDWGTSNLRAYLLDNGELINEYSSSKGLIFARELGFKKVLSEVLEYFQVSDATTIRLSGMIGSKHGWQEAPYAHAPVAVDDLQENTVALEEYPDAKILGGVCFEMANGKRDVMRGEEVQVFGVLEKHPDAKKVCLPGTHSKWVDVEDTKLNSFSTWMTGDLFRSLSQYTIFKEQYSSTDFNEQAFLKGVNSSSDAGPLMNSLFHLRTDYLFQNVNAEEFYSYLSGFLIGSEVKEAAKGCEEVYLCGSGVMNKYYELALQNLGVKAVVMNSDEATILGIQAVSSENKNG
ncbi:MAG: 2-dehydro-3-deoxygalactonokinase [Lentisphaeraceae bacterium]|nr:2-dehydro-3-deoxygalactonokinase [Lentisphaeraceae bacterium]